MERRGFKLTKKVGVPQTFHVEWWPEIKEYKVITKRILQRIKDKPNWYRWYGEKKTYEFFERMLTTYMKDDDVLLEETLRERRKAYPKRSVRLGE